MNLINSISPNPYKVRAPHRINYKDINFNIKGWADSSKYLPIPFDLVVLKTSTDKTIQGWWDKKEWSGLFLRTTDKIIEWKRITYERH